MLFEAISINDRARVLGIEIVNGEKAKSLVLSTSMAIGLKGGLDYSVDGGKAVQLPFSHCQGGACFAVSELTEPTLSSLKKAKTMALSFSDPNGSKIKLEIKMDGFSLALSKL